SRILQYTVLLEPMASDALFIPGVGVALRGGFQASRVGLGGRRPYVFRDSSDSFFNPFHNYSSTKYQGVSRLPTYALEKLRAAGTQYPQGIEETYLQLPKLDPRIAELAQRATANAATPVDKAIALETYPRTKYSYTLNLTGKPGKDPLAHFLFETRA